MYCNITTGAPVFFVFVLTKVKKMIIIKLPIT